MSIKVSKKERRILNRKYYLKNTVSRAKSAMEAVKRWKKIIFDHYGWRCNCCGETTPKFLTIDHVNNDGYKDVDKGGRRILGSSLYCRIIREGFPDFYQILCFNCNFGKNVNKGICPHKEI